MTAVMSPVRLEHFLQVPLLLILGAASYMFRNIIYFPPIKTNNDFVQNFMQLFW
jgi:hypothetical protein